MNSTLSFGLQSTAWILGLSKKWKTTVLLEEISEWLIQRQVLVAVWLHDYHVPPWSLSIFPQWGGLASCSPTGCSPFSFWKTNRKKKLQFNMWYRKTAVYLLFEPGVLLHGKWWSWFFWALAVKSCAGRRPHPSHTKTWMIMMDKLIICESHWQVLFHKQNWNDQNLKYC